MIWRQHVQLVEHLFILVDIFRMSGYLFFITSTCTQS